MSTRLLLEQTQLAYQESQRRVAELTERLTALARTAEEVARDMRAKGLNVPELLTLEGAAQRAVEGIE